jgi:hypothetical protein
MIDEYILFTTLVKEIIHYIFSNRKRLKEKNNTISILWGFTSAHAPHYRPDSTLLNFQLNYLKMQNNLLEYSYCLRYNHQN